MARLVINTQRRTADESDYDELAEFLQRTEPGKEKWQVASGTSIAERISQLTRMHVNTIRLHLDSQFKDPSKVRESATDLVAKEISVPEPVAESVQEAVQELKKIVEEHPEKKARGYCSS